MLTQKFFPCNIYNVLQPSRKGDSRRGQENFEKHPGSRRPHGADRSAFQDRRHQLTPTTPWALPGPGPRTVKAIYPSGMPGNAKNLRGMGKVQNNIRQTGSHEPVFL